MHYISITVAVPETEDVDKLRIQLEKEILNHHEINSISTLVIKEPLDWLKNAAATKV
jgi:hypothetical protein